MRISDWSSDVCSSDLRDGRNRDLADADAFDARVEQAVRRFQEQQGLPVNGRAGPEPLEALHAALELRRQRPRPAAAGIQADDPRDSGHPAHALDRRIRGEVATAEFRMSKSWDARSERLPATPIGFSR